MAALNPNVQVRALATRADAALLHQEVPRVDLVLDCTDNFATRHLVNAACVRHGRPLVSGAAIGFDGQISVYDSRSGELPCYACLFPPEAQFEEVQCASLGVFAPLVGMIGAMGAVASAAMKGGQLSEQEKARFVENINLANDAQTGGMALYSRRADEAFAKVQ
jgi:molybdopterin/thiamine biosynthesis adenylyltransferase